MPGIARASSTLPGPPLRRVLACCPSNAPASLDARRSQASLAADQRSPQLCSPLAPIDNPAIILHPRARKLPAARYTDVISGDGPPPCPDLVESVSQTQRALFHHAGNPPQIYSSPSSSPPANRPAAPGITSPCESSCVWFSFSRCKKRHKRLRELVMELVWLEARSADRSEGPSSSQGPKRTNAARAVRIYLQNSN